MLKKNTMALFFYGVYSLCFANLIINEFLYDPVGSDSGKEWIELFNNSENDVVLTGWTIEKAGSEFVPIYTFTETIFIAPKSYFLIGEIQIQHADYFLSLGLQNGGSATDGVRLVSPGQNYTDTALYDAPNENNLPDDENAIAIEFLDDIADGKSWGRVQNGIDTNRIEDWCIAEETTPGFPNVLPVDIAIDEIAIIYEDENATILVTIHNLSTFLVENVNNFFSLFINDSIAFEQPVPTLEASGFASFEISLPDSITYCKISGLLDVVEDIDETNNEYVTSFYSGKPPVLLNEIMIQPNVGGIEWIEILSTLSSELSTTCVQVVDNSERYIEAEMDFSKPYQILCSNKTQFLEENPTVQPEIVCEATAWTTLNNTSETLLLRDSFGNEFDSLAYSFSSLERGISYERKHPELSEWQFCLSTHTAGEVNSIFPAIYDYALENSTCIIEKQKLLHSIDIKKMGLESVDIATCIINGISLSGKWEFQYPFALNNTLSIAFESDLPANGLWQLTYTLEVENDEILSNNSNQVRVNINALPVVINEIMFEPYSEEPEWIEFYNNELQVGADFTFIMDGNPQRISVPNENYFLLVDSEQDSLWMREQGVEVPIFIGLQSLSNQGEQIEVWIDSTIVEQVHYNPDWIDRKGYSIERINASLFSSDSNWMQCPNKGTPGEKNAVAVEDLPTKAVIEIHPNPFSPYRNEVCSIQIKLPELVNKAEIKVYDLKGRMIRTIQEVHYTSSECKILFDGKSKFGKKLRPGIYFVVLNAVGKSNKNYQYKKELVIGYK